MVLAGPGIGVSACGGRSLDADGLPGPASGQGGANSSTTVGGIASGSGGNGKGNSTKGSTSNGSSTKGSTSNGGRTSGSTAATTGGMGSSTRGGTSGNPGGQGSCDDPYDLNELEGSFSGFTSGPSAFKEHCNGAGPELFFTWEAPRDGGYRIHTEGSEIDTVLYRLNRSSCDGRIVDCNDDANGGPHSELLFEAEHGERMTFVLDSFYASGGVRLTIEQYQTPPCGPAHRELSGVGQLVAQELPFDDSTLTPTQDVCGGEAPRMSFHWTAPNDGLFTFDTLGSNYDTVLVVRTICEIRSGYRCNDDEFGLHQSGIDQQVQRGQVLRVEVSAFGGDYLPLDGSDVPFIVLNVHQ